MAQLRGRKARGILRRSARLENPDVEESNLVPEIKQELNYNAALAALK